MATGDLIKLGTLYSNGAKLLNPANPKEGGNIPRHGINDTIEIRNTDTEDAYKMRWREINDGGKKYLVSDRVVLSAVSWDNLNTQSLIFGKNIAIEGKQYRVRVMTGGSNFRNISNPTWGGTPTDNEWDRWVLNQAGLVGLPTPTDAEYSGANRDGTHNQFWNWSYIESWSQETYTGNSSERAVRGGTGAGSWRNANSILNNTGYGWRPVLEVLNAPPTVTVTSPTANQTLHENSTITIAGSTTDTDVDDVVTVKYQIDSGAVRNLHSAVSDGSVPINFAKTLTYKDGVLKDGNTVLTSTLDKDTPHTVSVWAEDGKGGKSNIITRTFFVVPNRAPVITVNPIATQSDLINSNVINVSGAVADADKNDVTVTFSINGGVEQQVYQGPPAAFTFNILLNDLKVGANTLIVKATDTYNTSGTKTLTINKVHNATPVNKAVALYKITAPTGSAKSILLWLASTLGTLDITTEVSLTNNSEAENFVALTKTNSVVANGLRKEEFAFKGETDKTNIVIKITYNRTDSSVIDTIKQISGVLF